MADVFISYAREDKSRAEQVAHGLQGAGIDVFWDSEIPPGQTWADYIEGKLSQCKAVIVLWSANSTRSQWVREEARMGRDKGKLIPVQLDDSPAPFGFGEVQAANLRDWNGQGGHPEWERTLAAVRTIVANPNAPTPPPRPQPAAQSTIHSAYTPPVSDAPKKPWFQNVWVLAGGGVLAVLVLLGVIGAVGGGGTSGMSTQPVDPSQQQALVGPQGTQPAQPQVNYQAQLQAQLAEVSGYMAQEGFQPVGTPFVSGLAQGASQAVPVELHQGFEYRIVAVCDQDCSDIDLRLNDQNNNEVAADIAMDDRPIVQVAPRWTGPFQLNVQMATCTVAPCYFAAQLYGKTAGQ